MDRTMFKEMLKVLLREGDLRISVDDIEKYGNRYLKTTIKIDDDTFEFEEYQGSVFE